MAICLKSPFETFVKLAITLFSIPNTETTYRTHEEIVIKLASNDLPIYHS